MISRPSNVLFPALGLVAALAAPAEAGSHLWVINEVFSNADGTIQFIEMKECCGAENEVFLATKWVMSEATGNLYTFTANLPCTDCTAFKHLLLATAGFAALPGAPTPDYIIEDNFIHLTADTVKYWMYANSPLTYEAGDLPLDGVRSFARDGTNPINTPTNFADETGSIDLRCDPADVDGNGAIDFTDLLGVLSAWGPCAGCLEDIDQSGAVDFPDLLAVLSSWGPCP